jgi:hypothetical protein
MLIQAKTVKKAAVRIGINCLYLCMPIAIQMFRGFVDMGKDCLKLLCRLIHAKYISISPLVS